MKNISLQWSIRVPGEKPTHDVRSTLTQPVRGDAYTPCVWKNVSSAFGPLTEPHEENKPYILVNQLTTSIEREAKQ